MTLAIASMAGCQTMIRTGATDRSVCSLFPPITYSSHDTAETVIQIRRHNAGYDSYCGRR